MRGVWLALLLAAMVLVALLGGMAMRSHARGEDNHLPAQFNHDSRPVGPGTMNGSNQVDAWIAELDHRSSMALELHLTGIVISAPDNSTGIGTWQIRTGYATTSTVIAVSSTIFEGIPTAGEWVQVKGTLQLDDTVLALHIRRDHYEPAQVIVRLADGVLPETIAEKYNLRFVQQMLGLDDIVLFDLIDLGTSVEAVVDLLNADEDLVQWAQLNYILRVPEGDPYHVWEWGGEGSLFRVQLPLTKLG